MDSELEDFISRLDEPFSSNQKMNEMWKELEEYFDKAFFDIDKYLDELFPAAQSLQPSPMECDISIPEQSTPVIMEELFNSSAMPETFFNDLITDPTLNFKDKNCVPTEILLNSIRSHAITLTCRQYDHPYESIASYTFSSVPVAPFGYDFIAKNNTNLNPSLSSSIDWHTLLQNQKPYPGITVDVMVRNILDSCTTTQILPREEEISGVISSLFKDLNNYINRLSVEFDDHKFFDALQFDDISRKLEQEILSRSNIKTASLLDILSKWMEMVTINFVHINDERCEVEKKVLLKIIDRAVEIYRKRIVSVTSNEDILIARKKNSDIICQGIRRVYLNCGVNFNANVLRELEQRLKEVISTPEKPCISPHKTTFSNDSEVLIELLVSEYASSINQKGLQCAGISTIKQFDDVNATCLADIMRTLDRKIIEVPFAEQNGLKGRLEPKLQSESNSKRSQFKRRLQAVSVPSSTSSTCSPPTTFHSVGIHFGFEKLSVSCFNQVNNNFRSIYGPLVNVVSFAPQGVYIGEIPADGCFSLNMKNLLANLDVDRLYDTKYYGKFKLEAIIALVLMQIDEMVKKNLHTTTRIQYAIAIPSCLSKVMQHTFKSAMNIADISGNLVREQCALTTIFICKNHQAITTNKDEFVITMVENESKACDSVVYEITGKGREKKVIKVLCTDGSEASGFLRYVNNTGLKNELQKLKNKRDKRNRFLICYADEKSSISEIRNKFCESNEHRINFDSSKLADGAALLTSAYIDGNLNIECPFDFRHLTSISQLNGGVSNRLMYYSYYGFNADRQKQTAISTKLRSLFEMQSQKLAKSKTATKQFLLGKMKDLEESYFSDDRKREYRRNLEMDLKTVEMEPTNTFVVEKIADSWKKSHF